MKKVCIIEKEDIRPQAKAIMLIEEKTAHTVNGDTITICRTVVTKHSLREIASSFRQVPQLDALAEQDLQKYIGWLVTYYPSILDKYDEDEDFVRNNRDSLVDNLTAYLQIGAGAGLPSQI